MITSFKTDLFDLTGQMNAVALNNIDVTNGESLKVYIPKVMPNIQKGEPTTSIVRTNGYSVFKNANRKPTLTGMIIKEKNYFETNFNVISNVDDLSNVTNQIINEINDSISQLAYMNDLISTYRRKKLKYEINKGTELRVEFLNGKLNRLSFMTMDKTKTNKILKNG